MILRSGRRWQTRGILAAMAIRHIMPLAIRRGIAEVLRRLVDGPRDLAGAFAARGRRLPPPSLRYRSLGTSSRRTFRHLGEQAARQIAAALDRDAPDATRLLDFGCGSGRVTLALHAMRPGLAVVGVDVNAAAIAWCRRHAPGQFHWIRSGARLPFTDGSFDCACAINVFTHFDETEQFAALREVQRVLRPEGLLIVTTRPFDAAQPLNARGFAFSSRPGDAFKDRLTWHSPEYLREAWSPAFELLHRIPRGVGLRDVVVFRRR
jgi:SAM-dependent methyltransferase